jgi:hypothetical protein
MLVWLGPWGVVPSGNSGLGLPEAYIYIYIYIYIYMPLET